MKLSSYNMKQRRELMDNLLSKGRMASITFRKKTTGEITTRVGKLWVERHLTSQDKRFVGVNPVAAKDPDIYPFSDIQKADAFRSFSLMNLVKVVSGDKVYEF